MYQQSELNELICTVPLQYADRIQNRDPEHSLKNTTQHQHFETEITKDIRNNKIRISFVICSAMLRLSLLASVICFAFLFDPGSVSMRQTAGTVFVRKHQAWNIYFYCDTSLYYL